MIRSLSYGFGTATVCVLLIMSAGCSGSSPRTRFYLLAPLDTAAETNHEQRSDHRISVGIAPVELPAYLDRPQIVTRLSDNQLRLAEFDHWAEPLQDTFSRVLIENVCTLLCADSIAVSPWRRSADVDYRVRVEVIRMDSDFEGVSSLVARWTITGDNGKTLVLAKKSSYTTRTSALDYGAIVAAHSTLIGRLSEEIAKEIKALSL